MKKPESIDNAIARLRIAKMLFQQLSSIISDNTEWKEDRENEIKELEESGVDGRDWRYRNAQDSLLECERMIVEAKALEAILTDSIL